MELSEILYKLDSLIESGKQNTIRLQNLRGHLERIANPEEFEDLDDIQPLHVEEFPEATEEEIMKLNFLRITGTELQFDDYIKQLKEKYND